MSNSIRNLPLYPEFILSGLILIMALIVTYPFWFCEPVAKRLVWFVAWVESVEERMRGANEQ